MTFKPGSDPKRHTGVAGPATYARRLLEDLETAIRGRVDRTYEGQDVIDALVKCRKQLNAGLQRARWKKRSGY